MKGHPTPHTTRAGANGAQGQVHAEAATQSSPGGLARLCRKLVLHVQASPLIPTRIRRRLVSWAGVRVSPGVLIAPYSFFGGGEVNLGQHVFVNAGAFLDGSGPITIGDYTRLGPKVTLLTGTHAYRRSTIRRGPFDPTIARPIVIERGCWLGVNTTVLPGVTIREGCVIAAGAVVIRDTEPNGMYAGNPARRIKDLPTDEPFDELRPYPPAEADAQ